MYENRQYTLFQQAIIKAGKTKVPLQLVAGNSKAFYGQAATGDELPINDNKGIINYYPSELVITVKAGTSLTDLKQHLALEQQMLGFEPPHFAEAATIGGAIATGLSGPRRAFSGSTRDFVLGCKIINGKGEILHFGGEVMKNVAGYDVSRLMVGAMGTLGLILEVSLRVLPQAKEEQTLGYSLTEKDALLAMIQWRRQYLPITAMCYDNKFLRVRLSGSAATIQAAITTMKITGQRQDNCFWYDLNEQCLPFFQTQQNIWRIVVPPATPALEIEGQWFYDWGGALRWLKTEQEPDQILRVVQQTGGHAILFRGRSDQLKTQLLERSLSNINNKIKQAFDPFDILNRQRRIWEV